MSRRRRRGPVSPLKVGAGIMTGGLSLLFTGVRKKSPVIRRRGKGRVKSGRRPAVNTRQRMPPNPEPINPRPRPDPDIDTVRRDSMGAYIPRLTQKGWALFALCEFGIFITAFLAFHVLAAIAAAAAVYFIALAVGCYNRKMGRDYVIFGGTLVYDPPYHWDGDTSPAEDWRENKLAVTMEKVDAMDGHEFEHFIAGLLQKLGYENVSVTRGSGDQGVDVLAELNGIKYAIQCKNYASALGNTPVQEVSAGKEFYGCHVGVVVTNNYFTKGGRELADKVRVILWDREKLAEMMESIEGQ